MADGHNSAFNSVDTSSFGFVGKAAEQLIPA
jgi:hypothetical protein